ncbi:MAG: hypothetical protein CMO80_09230 [Verrucomicrobiales bacterium]|nr:hypothetical protein [Verrucomicrobiales bacterium]|tara:strand:+ start:6780 stop:7421 length:642 start_codon:yes stop_codon:yes gene_type:complete
MVVFMIGYAAVGALSAWIASTGTESQWKKDTPGQIFIAFLQMTDPGNMAQDIESSPWLKIPAVLAGVVGIVLLYALIAFITTALIDRMNALKKGRSRVIEDEHTLILSWQPQRVVEIIREEKNLSDAQTVKAIPALTSACDPGDRELYIVAEIFDRHHHEILASVLVQTSRSVGLSVAYGEILSFDGCEMYFHQANWRGITFAKCSIVFPTEC